jgi:2-polyprenyl-6-methoxyphenol hydroxylase-like FAD-dependent oxidoreductase
MQKIGDHAVVLGAGIAGLLAARVVADAYEHVTVVERDLLPEASEYRRGVPQDRHAHNLLASGAQIIDELFPGLLDELESGSASVVRDFAEVRFSPAGHRLRLRGRTAEPFMCLAGRPYLEDRVRARVRALPTVDFADRCEAVGPATTATRDRVTGVRIVRRATGGTEQCLAADLVIDATGRTGRTPAWLTTLGYDRPQEERLAIDVKYASQLLRLRPCALGAARFVAVGAEPGRPTGFVLLAQEEDRWILTLIGYDTQHPPIDPDGFVAFVETVAAPDVCAAIRNAEPLGGIVGHRFPTNLRRRYERLRTFPAGLLVVGDAVCSTNPSYALGMSTAALQAAALRHSLTGGDHDLARRFFRPASKPIDRAWRLTIGSDLNLPPVRGTRPLSVRVINAYVDRVLNAAEHDPTVAEQFRRVAALQHPPTRLLRPLMARRVLFGSHPHDRVSVINPDRRAAVTAAPELEERG